MKTTFLALCLFLFAYSATSFIVDTDGEPVTNAGGEYHLIPVSNQLNGGLGLASVGNDTYPKTVVLDPNNSPGLPVRFGSPILIYSITESIFLHIKFVSSSYELTKWDVDLEFPVGWIVKVSNTETFMGPFKVKSTKKGYKIVYYPGLGETGADIGIVHRDGHYRLAVKDGDPFIFKIKKKATESSAGIMSIV